MTVEDSFAAMLELLDFQFDSNRQEVSDFVNNLYCLVEKLIPKKNCMEIVSPPGAGKNFFFDAVLSFYINRGTVRNFNRFSSFPLQDTVGRRILVWNEPNCESSALDSVAVKYSADQTITRTPSLSCPTMKCFLPMKPSITACSGTSGRPAPSSSASTRRCIPWPWSASLTSLSWMKNM